MIDVINYETYKGDLPDFCAVINMPETEYRNHPAISKSDLDLIDRSVAHYVYRTPFESTRAMEIGTAIHAAMFEHERYKDEYCILQNVKARTASEYKQAVKVHGSSRVLIGHESDKVNGMYQSIQLNQDALDLINRPGWCEIAFFAICKETGLAIKCRFDFLSHDWVATDLKKTQDVRYEKAQRSIGSYRYHVQDAFYNYVVKMFTLEKNGVEGGVEFNFLFVEEMPPHANKVYDLDDEAYQVGTREMMRNLKDYEEYLKKGDSLPEGLVQPREVMSLPAWALDEQAEMEYDV